jgi:hypothetical protein
VRQYFFLIILAIASAFGVGYFGFTLKGQYVASESDRIQIRKIKTQFLKSSMPLVSINFRTLFPNKYYQELIGGRETLKDNASDFHTQNECFEAISKIVTNFSAQKAYVWERFRCGLLKILPGSFFSTPPFVHPGGHSYVYLFARLYGSKKVDSSWIRKHLGLLRSFELDYMEKKVGELPLKYRVVSELDGDLRAQIFKGPDDLVTKNYYLVQDWDVFNFFENIYYVFQKESFFDFVGKTEFTVSEKNNKSNCLIEEQGLCWNFSLPYLIKQSGYIQIAFTLALMIFIIIAVFTIFFMISKDREQDEKRKFALRVLSHELRTPLTGLLLKLETLLGKLESFDDDSQEKLLRISNDAQRLRRLIEMSRNYLSAGHRNNIAKIKNHTILSLNDFLSDFSLQRDDRFEISFIELEKDVQLKTDPYWFQVCIKNLIENARVHGKPPVELQVVEKSGHLEISVKDMGVCEFVSLNEMQKEFLKGNQSEGTGLGLNIVSRITKELGFKLKFSVSPTCFTIIIPKEKYDEIIIS